MNRDDILERLDKMEMELVPAFAQSISFVL